MTDEPLPDDCECDRCHRVVPGEEATKGTGPLWPYWFCHDCAEELNAKHLEVAA